MTDAPLLSATFHADNGTEWTNDELLYVPRVGDRLLEEGPGPRAFVVEEVWEVGENFRGIPYGTHVFVKETELEGTRLHALAEAQVSV